MPREVPLEERFVDRHVLHPDHVPLVHLEDLVHEQERIAVREHLHDVFDAEHGSSALLGGGAGRPRDGWEGRRSGVTEQFAHERHRAAMARLVGDDACPHAPAREGQVSHAVHRLVSDELVGPAQRRVTRPTSSSTTAFAVEAPWMSPFARSASTSRTKPNVRAPASSRAKLSRVTV
jgi:hypothetical protein